MSLYLHLLSFFFFFEVIKRCSHIKCRPLFFLYLPFIFPPFSSSPLLTHTYKHTHPHMTPHLHLIAMTIDVATYTNTTTTVYYVCENIAHIWMWTVQRRCDLILIRIYVNCKLNTNESSVAPHKMMVECKRLMISENSIKKRMT